MTPHDESEGSNNFCQKNNWSLETVLAYCTIYTIDYRVLVIDSSYGPKNSALNYLT